MLTEDDDLIWAQDILEHMQLAMSSLFPNVSLSLHQNLMEEDIDDAATWVTSHLFGCKTRNFFSPNGPFHMYSQPLVLAVSYALHFLFIPGVWSSIYLNTQTRLHLIFQPSGDVCEDWAYQLVQAVKNICSRPEILLSTWPTESDSSAEGSGFNWIQSTFNQYAFSHSV